MSPVLSNEILRKPRTYDEYIAWIEATMEAVCVTPERRAEARLADGPFKIFREEVLSFRPVAERLYAGSNAVIMFPADNGPRDAVVTEAGKASEQLFEIVTAGDGYDNRLRMELLSTEGHAPAFGPIQKVGPNKRNYQVVADTRAVNRQTVIDDICNHVVAAIERKKRGQYGADVWLVVRFDGGVVRESDLAQIIGCATEVANSTKFPRVYLTATISGSEYCERVR